jgi:hypothetical protein
MKNGMMSQKKIPPKMIAISRWALLYSRSDHFLYLFIVGSASTRPFLFSLSTAWLTGMTAAGLKMPYFDPVISKKKPQFFWPWHIDSKICKERSWIWFNHNGSF